MPDQAKVEILSRLRTKAGYWQLLLDDGDNTLAVWSARGTDSLCWDPGHTGGSLVQDLHRQNCTALECAGNLTLPVSGLKKLIIIVEAD